MAAKGINTSFSGPLLVEVTEYASRCGMSNQDAVRELVRLGLSVAPMDAVAISTRQRGFDDARRYTMQKISEAMTQVSKDLEQTLGLQIWGSTPPRNGG